MRDPGSWLGHVSTRGGQGQNYSFGREGWDRTFPTAEAYIRRQIEDNHRTGLGLVVKPTSEQDGELGQCMAKKGDGAVYNKLINNCKSSAQMCLINSGVPPALTITPTGFQESLFDTGDVKDVNWYRGGP